MRLFKFVRAIAIRTIADEASKAFATNPRKRTKRQRAVINLWTRM